MALKATEVFTPGAFPVHTYVERSGDPLELSLKDALDTPGQVVSLIGPSKSGKTVLVERVVGRDSLITITGAGIESANEIWERVLDWMGSPITSSRGSTTGGKVSADAKVAAEAGVIVAKAKTELDVGVEVEHEREQGDSYGRAGLSQVVKEIGGSSFVVLVDDFHYMQRPVQAEAAKSLKEAVRLGVKVCTAAVRHRGDDLVRANPELRGRVRAIDLEYWRADDLKRIAISGFRTLNLQIDEAAITELIQESAGSPQLMQLLCLNTCFVLGMREAPSTPAEVKVTPAQMNAILHQTSASTDFRSLVDVIDGGPKTRGTERKVYAFGDGSKGDVYRCVLKAIAADPPRLSFSYDELMRRTARLCNGESPVGSSVVGTCLHMSKLAIEKFPNERSIDWDEQKQIVDLPDPYLLFYLRWSGRLNESD
jgi:hypothetical protein